MRAFNRTDARFAENPFVIGEPFIRFYAGAPLTTPHGFNLGTLRVLDTKPRRLLQSELKIFRLINEQIVYHLEQRREIASYKRAVDAFKRREKALRAHLDGSMQKLFKDSLETNTQTLDPFGTISIQNLPSSE